MKITINRRDFIRSTGMTGMAAMLTGPLLSSSLAPLYTCQLEPGNEFALLKLEKILPGYDFPFITSYSTADYRLKFTLYNLYSNFVTEAGSVEISRRSNQDPNFHVESARLCSCDVHLKTADQSKHFEGNYYFSAEIQADDNLLATPRSWLCRTKIARTAKAPPYMHTGHTWLGRLANGEISYESGPYCHVRYTENKDLSWKWGIIHLVQQMAERSIDEIHFSALDEMDMVYEHQMARFRKNKTMDCGTAQIDFKVFDVLGDGVIPTVYWVDDQHRVVFIVTGTEAYVLA